MLKFHYILKLENLGNPALRLVSCISSPWRRRAICRHLCRRIALAVVTAAWLFRIWAEAAIWVRRHNSFEYEAAWIAENNKPPILVIRDKNRRPVEMSGIGAGDLVAGADSSRSYGLVAAKALRSIEGGVGFGEQLEVQVAGGVGCVSKACG